MMKFKRTVTHTGEESIFTPAQFIEEVNAERSESWAPYTIKDALTIPNEIISHWLNNDYESWEVLPS
jgi:hypothetical protein